MNAKGESLNMVEKRRTSVIWFISITNLTGFRVTQETSLWAGLWLSSRLEFLRWEEPP